jgi:hypothetical protein
LLINLGTRCSGSTNVMPALAAHGMPRDSHMSHMPARDVNAANAASPGRAAETRTADVATRTEMGAAKMADAADVTASAEMPNTTEVSATEVSAAEMGAATEVSASDVGTAGMTATVPAPVGSGHRGGGYQQRRYDDGYFQTAEARHGNLQQRSRAKGNAPDDHGVPAEHGFGRCGSGPAHAESVTA